MLLTKNLKTSLMRIPLMSLGKKTEEEGEEIEKEEKFTSLKKNLKVPRYISSLAVALLKYRDQGNLRTSLV